MLALHEEHYRSSVNKANEILQRLQNVDCSTSNSIFSDLRVLKTSLQPIIASVKSYEIFFTHLGGDVKKPHKMLSERFVKDFGSYEAFVHELTSSAIASRGWVALAYDLDLKRLMVVIGDTPEQLTVWNNAPILVFEASATSAALEVCIVACGRTPLPNLSSGRARRRGWTEIRTWRTSCRAIFHASESRSAKRSPTQLAENSVGRNKSSVPVSLQKLPS